MQTKKLPFRRRMIIAGGIVAFGIAGMVGAAVEKAVTGHAAPPAVTIRSDATAAPAAGFAQVIKKDLPAVVSISTSKNVKASSRQEMSPLNDPFFERFFGNGG